MSDNSDFNDMAAEEGLAAVEQSINKAVAAAEGIPFGNYLVKKDGVYWFPPNKKGEDSEEAFFCSRLAPLGIARTPDGENFALVLEMTDADNRQKIWTLPLETVQRAGGEEARCEFARYGGFFAPGIRARTAFGDYLSSILRYARRNLPRLTLADRCGWLVAGEHWAFVLPGGTIGRLGEEQAILSGMAEGTPNFKQSGTLNDWQQQIGQYCQGNSRLMFAACLPLAAPLLFPTGGEGGGFNFVGPSSIGKTTLHHVAASLAGNPADFIKTCDSTSNAFEAIAALFNDSVLLFDELGQASPEHFGNTIYKLAGGTGRGRANQHGNARERKQWRAIFATTGETDLATMAKSAGKRAFTGQELRLCDIPADTGAHGVFESLHDFASPAEFADHLKGAASRYHGIILHEYLKLLVAALNDQNQQTELRHWLSDQRQRFIANVVPAGASGQIIRTASRFALVAAGGELATRYGLTSWQKQDASEAAEICFSAWLSRRGTAGHGEVDKLLRQVEAFFDAHGESRFTLWGASDKARPTPNRAGFRRAVTLAGSEQKIYEYYVLPDAFREMVCGFEPSWAASVLVEKELLSTGSDGKPQTTHRLPGHKPRRCYHFPIPVGALSDEKVPD